MAGRDSLKGKNTKKSRMGPHSKHLHPSSLRPSSEGKHRQTGSAFIDMLVGSFSNFSRDIARRAHMNLAQQLSALGTLKHKLSLSAGLSDSARVVFGLARERYRSSMSYGWCR